MIFFYDGTFEGLLSAVFDAYTEKVFPDLLLRLGEIPPLGAGEGRRVETVRYKADRVLRALERKLPAYAFSGLLYAALADDAGHGTVLFRFIRKIFDGPEGKEGDLADPDVLAVEQLARKVGREKQHLMGFARFEKTAEGVYFALLEPRFDVLPLLRFHFTDRFGDQKWILYDARRGYGIFFDLEECREISLEAGRLKAGKLDPALLAEGEDLIRRLWQGYHAASAVRERLNPVLQRRLMPARFWKYLPEKS